MATAVQKIILSASRDIPFNKLVLSQANVRRVKAGVSIEELAEDIAHRTLLQGLSVRPVLDAEGQETGMFEVPAGGRRFRALELLVKQKRLAKTAPVPCIVREGGIAEEDSLAENVQRVALHPLDQFRAFQALRDKGLGEEEIAARFFVTPTVVKQRLRLAAVSSTLLDVYAEDGMTLEQLMAFTVTSDHARQEQVWDGVSHSYNKEPYHIRRQLTEGAVRAADRRAQFVGLDAYEAAGGAIMRDLFQHDDGGWLQDPALLDRLVIEKLQAEAETLARRGLEVDRGRGRLPLWPHRRPASADRRHRRPHRGGASEPRRAQGRTRGPRAAIRARPTSCPTRSTSGSARSRRPWLPSRIGRSATIRPRSPAPASSSASTAKARLRIDRGFVRPEDEAPVEPAGGGDGTTDGDIPSEPAPSVQRAVITIGGAPRSRGGGAGRGRRHPPAVRPAGDGADRPSHARAAGRAGE